jgi:biotin carboxylase
MHFVTDTPVEATLPPQSTLLLIVDPISTSCRIAQEATKRGHHVGAIWTTTATDAEKKRDPAAYGCASLRYKFDLIEGKDFNGSDGSSYANEDIDIVQSVVSEAARGFNLIITGCISGSGLPRSSQLADGLAKRLGLLPCTTPTTMIDVRNKFTQQTLLETATLRSIKQVRGLSLDDHSITNFLDSERYPVVVKLDEIGIHGGKIKLCHTRQEAVDHFLYLLQVLASTNNGCGSGAQIICQEFIRGVEVMVDSVSRNSKHKTCMVWRYDRRPANGERFVNFGMIPIESETHEAALAIPYVHQCLSAMGMKNGPSHAKCIVTIDGPVLIELNFRAHGGDGSWCHLARALTGGYSQVEASVDALLDPAAFEQLPDAPLGPFKAFGQQVHLVSHSAGEVTSMPGFQVMKHLPSFVSLSTDVVVGSMVDYTTNLSTSPGICVLLNKDESILKKDLDLLRYLEEINALFDYKTISSSLARPTAASYSKQQKQSNLTDEMEKPKLIRIFSNDPKLKRQGLLMKRMTTVDASNEVVVVVDPYSTGCLVVNEIQSRGYKVIACWTLGFSEEMKNHTPMAAGKMEYYSEVDEREDLADTVKVIYEAAGKLRVVACIAGGEAGVDCADAVSERMNLRTNGTQVANRRDKKIQQELIRDAGMRSVRQAAGSKWEHVVDFLQTEQYPVVLKPTDSAGSDGVKLCHNIEEAKDHFHHLFEVEAVNGGFNTEVLCQEFLR